MLRIAIVSATLLAVGNAQTTGDRSKTEFEVASIRVNPPQVGFHFRSNSDGGAPDLTNPGTFRCSNCTLATLIRKAFGIQNYQFPGRSSLGAHTFDVTAKIPAEATQKDYPAMMQNLLKDRFGLSYHYTEKNMRGYHLVLAKNGSKLKESTGSARGPAGEDSNRQPRDGNREQYGFGQGHMHEGLVSFNGSASYRGEHQTTADLAQILSDQLSLPVDDQTKLPGKYDISLRWAGDRAQSGANHAEGGAGHGDHGGGGPAGSTGSGVGRGEESGPTLFEALQSQLGLKLAQSEQVAARIFVVDHADPLPTAN